MRTTPCSPLKPLEAELKLTRTRAALLVVLAALLVVAGWLVVLKVQGPPVPAYRLQAQPLVQTVVATGRVASASRAQVGAQVAGVIAQRLVREGDLVAAGDVLAVLQADDYQARLGEAQAALADLRESGKPQADASLRRARSAFTQASREAVRRRELFARQLVSREMMEQSVQAEAVARAALEQAELSARSLSPGNPGETEARQRVAAAEALLEKTRVRAQVGGTVLTRDAEPGDVVQPGQVLFEIAREGETELLVPVDEKNLSVLALEQTAVCVADAYPERPFPATVAFIAPAVDPQRGSVDIRLRLDPVPEFLRQDMTVSVNVETGRRERALVVPNDALERDARGNPQVWKMVGGRIERAPVTLGLRGITVTEVTGGLVEGDVVLSAPGATLADGDRVRPQLGEIPSERADTATDREIPVEFD
ncbi:efflux RND transporter periplasmic adaptor subunit [Lysobacter sp. H23M47]|uniref:efflux RND transporter periplasmic adaptor subunit n=1 Tax=Lysobacter sp. H23M47 TaxID=2781024 RepID=UPI001D160C28|nr:efflux RND transporter periplasmic adaptor subunit [Lysobacter sp. H23M47]